QINSDGEQFRPEQAYCRGIGDATSKLASQPALPVARIVIRHQERRAGAPASEDSVAQLQPHARIARHVADVSGFPAVFSDEPKLVVNAAVAYRSATRLPGFTTDGLEQSIAGWSDSQGK